MFVADLSICVAMDSRLDVDLLKETCLFTAIRPTFRVPLKQHSALPCNHFSKKSDCLLTKASCY